MKPKNPPKKDKYTFGLIGYPLSHSFSPSYFSEKFYREDLPYVSYEAFPLEKIEDLEKLVAETPHFLGFNITIPYKEQIIPFLSEIEENAKTIGAVNTVKIVDGRLLGFNTDTYGFEQSLRPFLKKHHQKALILGTGGASKAVAYVLKELGIDYAFVSRNTANGHYTYDGLTPAIIQEHLLIVNTTPLGMAPNNLSFPLIPYEAIGQKHLLYDLVYNPEETIFMVKGKLQGATVCNGWKMLILQAEKAWEIWDY